ncbi:MAG: M24 family metallopeptidase [Brevinematia bacterium]
MKPNYSSRIDRLLIETGGCPFITSKAEDIYYFSGFEGDFGFIVLSHPKSFLLTIKMFEEETKVVDTNLFNVIVLDRKEIFKKIVDILLELDGKDIFISSTNTNLYNFIQVIESAKDKKLFGFNKKLLSLREDHFSVANFRVFFKENLTWSVRSVKDNYEISKIKENLTLSDEGFIYLMKKVKPGMREHEVAAELEYYLRYKGAEGVSFPTIVASGYRSSIPHGRASSKVIQSGEPVVIDFGLRKDMYCTDTTRTVFFGNPPQEFVDTYKVVLEALNEGISCIKEGVSASFVDNKVRGVISKYNLGDYFVHSTGHGVGLEIHEAPMLNSSSNEILKEGMIVTVEPGIYIPGKFGIRIENMVLVKKDSSEVLTTLGTDLLVL